MAPSADGLSQASFLAPRATAAERWRPFTLLGRSPAAVHQPPMLRSRLSEPRQSAIDQEARVDEGRRASDMA